MINVSIHGVADTSITNSEAKDLIPARAFLIKTKFNKTER